MQRFVSPISARPPLSYCTYFHKQSKMTNYPISKGYVFEEKHIYSLIVPPFWRWFKSDKQTQIKRPGDGFLSHFFWCFTLPVLPKTLPFLFGCSTRTSLASRLRLSLQILRAYETRQEPQNWFCEDLTSLATAVLLDTGLCALEGMI